MIVIFKSACFNTDKCPVLTWEQLQELGDLVLILPATKLYDQLDFLLFLTITIVAQTEGEISHPVTLESAEF